MSENTFMPEEIFLNVQDLCSFILILPPNLEVFAAGECDPSTAANTV